jgi:RimJ/RimL family protein N-acetyltransferase
VTVPELETDRLLLRGFGDADLDGWAAICADPEVMRWIDQPRGISREQSWRDIAYMVGHWELRGFGQWAVRERDGGALVGRTGLIRPEGWPGIEVGWIVARARWGRGYAPEAAQAAVGWGRDALGLDHVISLIDDDNAASQRVAEKLGMREEGRTRIRDGTIPVRIFGKDLGSHNR